MNENAYRRSGPKFRQPYVAEMLADLIKEPRLIEGDLDKETFEAIRRTKNPRIGLDTETDGLDEEQSRLLVVQLMFDYEPILIRSLWKKPPYLSLLLADADITKIFHYALFDLRFMDRWGVRPRNIVCTKIMSKILRPNASEHSLQSLVECYFGVRLIKDKGLRVSDWGAEGLSPEQISYATHDVLYLPALAELMLQELKEADLWPLARRCFEHIPTRLELERGHYGDIFSY